MGRTLIAGPDAFTGTDGTNVSTYSANWKELDGVNGFLRIYSNGFRNAYTTMSDCSWQGAGTFTGDQYFKLTLVGSWTINDEDLIGGSLRNSGQAATSRDCYRVYFTPALNGVGGVPGVKVGKVVNDVETLLGANISASFASGDTLEAEAFTNGANVDIVVYKNGTAIGTRTDTSSVLTGGKPGICGRLQAGAIVGDNWEAGNATATADTPLVVTGGQLVLQGSDVTLSYAIAFTVDAGSLTLAGSDVGLLSSSSATLAVDSGSLALEGSVIVLTPSVGLSLVVDGAQMAFAGSEIPFILEQPYTSGEIALEGSDVGVVSGSALSLAITPGSIALEGGTASLTIPTTPGELVIQGSDLAMTQSSALALIVDAGALVLQGQSVGFDMALWVLPDQIALAGQDVTMTALIESIVAAALALQGSSVELVATGTNLPSEIEGGPIEGESDFAHRIDTDYLETSPKS